MQSHTATLQGERRHNFTIMVIHTHSTHSSESISETVSVGTCSRCSPSSFSPEARTDTVRASTSCRRGRTHFSSHLVGLEALFLLLTFIEMVYIFTCSTRSYANVYREEAVWLPKTVTRNHRDMYFDEESALVMNVTFTRQEQGVPRHILVPHPQVLFYHGKSFKAETGRRIHSRYDFRITA